MRHRRAVAWTIICLLLTTFSVSITVAQDPATTDEPVESTVEVLAATGTLEQSTLLATPSPMATATTVATETTYTIRAGENLFRIALRFGLSTRQLAEYNGIVNPAVIYAGQTIRIPGGSGTPPTPIAPATPTPIPTPTTTYTVARGDTLARIALRFNSTVTQLQTINNIRNPNLIYIGQVLNVPSAATTLPGVIPTNTVTAPTIGEATATVEVGVEITAETGTAPTVTTGFGFGQGVSAFLVDQDVPALTDEIVALGVTWVKQEILWRDFEPVRGEIDFNTLDNIVNTLRDNNLNILLTVSAAPAWARASTDENGPPDNFADYGTFVGALADRYAGQVQAYEIWNEPNLRREWNSSVHSIGATSYIELLRAGYNAIKTADPTAVVISAGLAPTGYNDGVNAISDRVFLPALYAAGLADVSDAIGAHPLGWANPPDAVCCEAPVGVLTHFEDSSFYFLETLRAYRDIMVQGNDSNTAIWVTKFGWGTSEDTDPPSANYVFVTYTTLGEQAIYDARGFELGAELGFVGPMFLDNLNGCQVQLGTVEPCYYSLVGLDGAPRPVFAAIQAAINPTTTEPVVEPTAETVQEQPTLEAPTVDPPTPETIVEPTTEAAPLPADPAATQEAVDVTG